MKCFGVEARQIGEDTVPAAEGFPFIPAANEPLNVNVVVIGGRSVPLAE